MLEIWAILPRGSIIRGRYVVEDWLGKGGFSAVYLVRDVLVKHNLFALKEVIDPDGRERKHFLFEAELLKRLDHRALARVYRVFDDETHNRAYMLMDYIAGPNLERLRQQQPGKCFSFPQVLTIMASIMEAVEYLHSQQPPILHRDIKPSNIIVPETGGAAVLVDFGIAKEYTPDSTTAAIRHCSPGYAAPEQYSQGTSTRTDVYELGATIYSLLTGKVPADAFHRMVQVSEGGRDPLAPLYSLVPALPQHLAQAIHHAMSLQRNERFATVEEFWQALHVSSPAQEQLAVMSPHDALPARVASSSPSPLALDSLPPSVVPPAPFAPSHQPLLPPATVTVRPRSRISNSKKLILFLLFLLAVVLGFSLGASTWSYLIHLQANYPTTVTSTPRSVVSPTLTLSPTRTAHSVSPTPRPTKVPTPPPTAVPTSPPVPHPKPTPTPIPYPNVAGDYTGSIDDTTENITTTMALLVKQKAGQGSIRGNFQVGPALAGSGSFSGNVTTTHSIQFTVQSYKGNAPLFFSGHVQSNGSMSGSYCSLNAHNQCDPHAGDAGTWKVTRASSAHTLLSSLSNSLQNAYNGLSDAASIAVWAGIAMFFNLCLLVVVRSRIRTDRTCVHELKMNRQIMLCIDTLTPQQCAGWSRPDPRKYPTPGSCQHLQNLAYIHSYLRPMQRKS